MSRITRGMDYVEDMDQSFDAIRDAAHEGDYLSHPTTLDHFRRTYDFPQLFDYQTLSQWDASAPPPLLENARRIAEVQLAQYDYRLDTATQMEIERIYNAYVTAKGVTP